MSAAAKPTLREDWANNLRGLAALIVVAFHFGVAFWVHQVAAASLVGQQPLWTSATEAPRFAQFIHGLPVEFGGLGVSLFFLLSGYVIAFSLNRYSRSGFLVGRCFRVLPLYAAGFLLGCLALWLFATRDLPLTFAGIATGMVPGLTRWTMVPAPDDGVVWTLIVEMVFYALCLLLHRWLTKQWLVVLAVMVACVASQYFIWNLGHTSLPLGLQYFLLLACPFLPLMLIGVIFQAHQQREIETLPTVVLVVGLVAGQVGLILTSAMLKLTMVYAASCVVAVVIFSAAYFFRTHWKKGPITGFFADISFPLYVVHPLVGYTVLSKLVSAGLPIAYAIAAATVLAILLSYILHLTVEKPSQILGRKLSRLLSA